MWQRRQRGSQVCVTRHTARASRRRARAGARRPHRPAGQTDKHSTRRISVRRGAGSVEPGLRTKALRLSHSAVCSRTTHRHARCAPVRRATATVARLTPCDSVHVLSYLSALAAREAKTGQRPSSPRQRRRRRHLRPGVWSPLPAEKPRVGKASAALPRDGRESRRRESGDHLPGRRCPYDCAGGAVVKMPSLAARAAPPASVARLLAA